MSSLEIAELTGKRHDNVMRDIRIMLTELYGEEGVPKFEDTYRNGQNGQKYLIFQLPKRETLILVSGYNLTMRSRIIDRWQVLEEQVTGIPLPDFTSPVIAARAWADEYEGRLIAEQKVEEATHYIREKAPAVEFYDAEESSLEKLLDVFLLLSGGWGTHHYKGIICI